MRRLLLTIGLSCLVATCAFGSNSRDINDPATDDSPGGPEAAGFRSDIPAIASFIVGGPAQTDIFCTGLGYHNGIFWVSGGDFDGDGTNGAGDNGIYLYDETGSYIGGFPQPTQDTWGWRDSGYNGTHLMYGASSPHDTRIFYVNVETLAVDHEFEGCPFDPCRAIAIENSAGGVIQYKVSNYDGDIQTRLWVVGDGSSLALGSCPAPSTRPYGFAYDTGNNSLWVTTSNPDVPGLVYELDPVSCAEKNVYDLQPEAPRFGGAVMANTSHGCDLWTLCQCTDNDMLFGWDTGGDNPYACGTTAVESATWGSIKARYND